MKKFVIISPSLSSFHDHNYEFSISVAEAAARANYQTIIIANRVLRRSLSRPLASLISAEMQIIPIFEVDEFNHPTEERLEEVKGNESLLNNGLNFQEMWHYQSYILAKKYPKLSVFFEKVAGSSQRLKEWIKDDLQLLRSIPLSNTLWGLFKIVWGLVYFVFKIGFELIKKTVVRTKPTSETPLNKVQSFTETLTQVLATLNLNSEDQIFIHSFGIEQLEELYHFLEKSDRSSLPTYHLLLRWDTDKLMVENSQGIDLKACLQSFDDSQLWPNKIRFYTDTEDLVKKYNALSAVQFSQVLIPCRQEKLKLNQPELSKDFINIVYLGSACSEKDYQYLLPLVENLWSDYLQTGKVKFTIQSNDNLQNGEVEVLAAKLNLCQYPESKVKLIKSPIASDHYYHLLASADIVILPYNPQNNRHTSRILTETLAAGKPVVVSDHSWLARQVDETRASIYQNPQELTDAVIRLLKDLPTFTQAAQEFSVNWRSLRSPDYFLDCLLKPVVWQGKQAHEKPITPNKIALNILVILDGNLALEAKNLDKVSYFCQCGYQVYGIFYLSEQAFAENALREQLKYYGLKKFWILTEKSDSINPNHFTEIEYQQYLDNAYYHRSSLLQTWMEASRLSVPDNLAETLNSLAIALVYSDSLLYGQYIQKLGLNLQTAMLEVSQFYSYQQAIGDRREVDPQEFNWEIEQLKSYSILITYSEPLAEKLQELTVNSQIYAAGNSKGKNLNYQVFNQACQQILGEKALLIEQFKPSPKIAILYPWGDIQERKTGASKRTGLMLDYLREQGYQIRLYTIGQQQTLWSEGVYYEYYEPYFEQGELVRKVYQDAYRSWNEDFKLVDQKISEHFDEKQDHWLPWIYYQFRFDYNFKNWLEKITDWADVVILEYPFWAYLLGEICQQKKVKFLLTAHDVLAKNLSLETQLGKIALGEELKALKKADQVVTLTHDDQAFFANYGIESYCIPIAINTKKNEPYLGLNDSAQLTTILGIPDLQIRPLALFIGSQHQPNIEAVKKIHQWSQRRSLNFDFVVVGSCWEPERTKNFLALGKVSEHDLACLYRQSAITIAPLLEGTGMSVKTLEALAYGKVLLGTAIAFRGYPVESDINCLICDNLDEYPDKINQLIQQPDVLKQIGQQAKEFSLAYDYRQLYKSYLDLIL